MMPVRAGQEWRDWSKKTTHGSGLKAEESKFTILPGQSLRKAEIREWNGLLGVSQVCGC